MDNFEIDTNQISQQNERAILVKGNMIGAIGVHGNFTTRFDKRAGKIEASEHCNDQGARRKFSSAIKTSIENGWRLAYCGQINRG